MPAAKRTILLSGMIAGDPCQGGATWAVLQYVLGFQRLGHEVLFVEPVQPKSLQPAGAALTESTNAAYFRAVAADFGIADAAVLLEPSSRRTVGLPYEELRRKAQQADVLINISGMLT